MGEWVGVEREGGRGREGERKRDERIHAHGQTRLHGKHGKAAYALACGVQSVKLLSTAVSKRQSEHYGSNFQWKETAAWKKGKVW